MKTITFALSLMTITMSSLSAHAQKSSSIFSYDRLFEMPKNEISVSMGYMFPYSDNFSSHYDGCASYALAKPASGYSFSAGSVDGNVCGNFEVRYLRNINKRLGVGLSFGFMGTEHEYLELPPESDLVAGISRRHYYVMPTIRSYWFNSKCFGLYSSASVGLGLCELWERDYNPNDKAVFNCDKNTLKFAGEIVPIGLEVGGKHLRYFFEGSVNMVGANCMFMGIKGMF